MPKRPRRTPTVQPHDSFLKFVFSEREHAAGLLKTLLPAEIAAAFDWTTLRLEKGSFVDRALRHRTPTSSSRASSAAPRPRLTSTPSSSPSTTSTP